MTLVIKLVDVPLEVDVALGVELAAGVEVAPALEDVAAGIAASRISTIFGGGRFTTVVDAVSGVVVAGAGSGVGGVVLAACVVVAEVVVGATGIKGTDGGTMTGSGKVGSVVVLTMGVVEDVVGVEVDAGGVVVGTAMGEGGIGNCSCIGVSGSCVVEVEAANSMYAELFTLKLPYGASDGRSCVSALPGALQPSVSTACGKMCACFISVYAITK
jgi:hypothetical protein